MTAILHLSFWKIGNWQVELKKLSFANQGIVQLLNIGSIYMLIFSAFITTIARKEMFERTDKLFLMLVAGCYIARIAVGFSFFGFSIEEIIVQVFCLLTACCYLIPIKN